MVVLVAILIFSKSWIKCKTKTKLLLQIVIHEIQDGHCCSTEYQGKCHRTCTDWLKIVVLVAKCIYLWVRKMQRQQFFPYLYDNFHQTPCSYAKCKCDPSEQKQPFGCTLTNPPHVTPLRPDSTVIDGFSILIPQRIAVEISYLLVYCSWKSINKCGAGTQWRNV